MRFSSVLAFASASFGLVAAQNYAAGFQYPVYTASANGTATCISGLIGVTASAQNTNLNFSIPADQLAVTEVFVDFLEAGSPFMSQIMGGQQTVSGTYQINGRLCYPRATGLNTNAVQILTHGVGYALTYWDSAPGYSYVDVAAAAGYTTFQYDRLSVGLSQKVDPIQVAQGPLEVAIAHSLIQMLRSGAIASTKFSHVVGVGHSYGSEITNAVTAKYPSDLDAAILTGFSLSTMGLPTFLTSLNLQIAAQNNPVRFGALNNGYLIQQNFIGNQFAFFKYPGFPASNLALAEIAKDTVTFGELLVMPGGGNATSFTGLVDVVNGVNDWPFCMGNCLYPTDLTAAVKSLYPAAKAFASYNAPLAGHGLNLHYSATGAFVQIQQFLKSNGL